METKRTAPASRNIYAVKGQPLKDNPYDLYAALGRYLDEVREQGTTTPAINANRTLSRAARTADLPEK